MIYSSLFKIYRLKQNIIAVNLSVCQNCLIIITDPGRLEMILILGGNYRLKLLFLLLNYLYNITIVL